MFTSKADTQMGLELMSTQTNIHTNKYLCQHKMAEEKQVHTNNVHIDINIMMQICFSGIK